MAECNQDENCYLKRTKKLLMSRNSSYEERTRGACLGSEKINKKAFVSMLGSAAFSSPPVTANSEVQADLLRTKIAENGGDLRKTANKLGMTIQTLLRKINPKDDSPKNYDETGSASPKRRYFERIESWKITSFSSFNGEVCVDVNSNSTTTHLSATVPVLRTYQ